MNYTNLTQEEKEVFDCLKARESGIKIKEANEYISKININIYINFSFFRKNLKVSKYSVIYFSK